MNTTVTAQAVRNVRASIEQDEPWLQLMQRVEDVKKLPREALIAHLTVLGWEPAIGTREAIQNGKRRCNIAERHNGLSAVYYEHYKELTRDWVKWDSISTPRLRMLAERIVHADWQKEHGYGP